MNNNKCFKIKQSSKVTALLSINKYSIVISGTLLDLKVWDMNSLRCIQTIKTSDSYTTNLLLLPNGFIAAGFHSGEICIIEIFSGRIIVNLNGHAGEILSLIFTKDNKLISKGIDGKIKEWSYK
jgi:WD40 repeat protein